MHWLAGIRAGFEEDITAVSCAGSAVTTGTQRGSVVAWRSGSGSGSASGISNDLALRSVRRRIGARVVRLLSGPDGTLALHADGTLTLWSDDTGACLASRAIAPLSSAQQPLLARASAGQLLVVAAPLPPPPPPPIETGQQQQQGVPSERAPAPPTALCLDWRTLEQVGVVDHEARLSGGAAGGGGAAAAARPRLSLAPRQQLARVAGMPTPGGGDRALAAAVVGTEHQVVMASGWLFGAPLTSGRVAAAAHDEEEDDFLGDGANDSAAPRPSAPLSTASFSHDGSLLLTVSRSAWQVYRRARRRDSRWVATLVEAVGEAEVAPSPFKAVRFQGGSGPADLASAASAAAETEAPPVSATHHHYVGGAVLRHSAVGADLVLWGASGAADWVRCAFDGGGRSTVLQRRSIDFANIEPIVDFVSKPWLVALATRRRVWLITAGDEGEEKGPAAAEGAAFAVQQGRWSIDRSIDKVAEELSIVDRLSTAATAATLEDYSASDDDEDENEGGAYAMAVGCNFWAPLPEDGQCDGGAATAAASAPLPKAAAATATAAPPLSPMYLGARRVAFFPPTGGVAIAGLAACCLPGASDRFSSSSAFASSPSHSAAVATCALRASSATLLMGAADGSVRALALSTAIDEGRSTSTSASASASASIDSVVVGAWHLHTAPVRRMLLPPLDAPAPWKSCVLTAADDGTLAVFPINVDRQQVGKSVDTRFFSGFPYGCPSHLAWHPASGVLVAGAVVGNKELCVWAWDLASGGLDRVLRGEEAHRLLGRLSCVPHQQRQESILRRRSTDRPLAVDADCFATVDPPFGPGGFLILDIDVSAVLTAAASRRAAHNDDRGAVADAASALGALHVWGVDPDVDSEVVSLLSGLGLITHADALRARNACLGGGGGSFTSSSSSSSSRSLVQVARAGGLGGFAVGFGSASSCSAPRHLCRLVALVALSDVLHGQSGVSDLGKLVDFCAADLRRSIDRSTDRLFFADESIDRSIAAAADVRLLASLTVHPTGPLRRAARWLLARRLASSSSASSAAGEEVLADPRGGLDVDWLCTLLAASAASSAAGTASTASLLALLSTPSLAGALAAKQLDRLLSPSSSPPQQQQPPTFSRADLFTRLSAVFETGLHASRDPQELTLLMLEQQQQQQQHQGPTTSALFCALGPLDLASPAGMVSVTMLGQVEQARRDARAAAEDELFRQPADGAWTRSAIDLAGTLCASPEFSACLQVAAASLSSEKDTTSAFLLAAIAVGVAMLVEEKGDGARDQLLPHLGLLGAVAVQAVDQARPTLCAMSRSPVASIVASLSTFPQAAAVGGVLFLGSAVARLPTVSSSSSFMLPVAVALPLATGGTRRLVCLLPLGTTANAGAPSVTGGSAAGGSSRALLPPLPPSAGASRARVSDAEVGMRGLDRWWGSNATAASSTAAAAAAAGSSSQPALAALGAAASLGASSTGPGSPAPSTDSLLKLGGASSSGPQLSAATEDARAVETLGLRRLHAGRAFYPSRPARAEPLFEAAGGVTAVALRACADGPFFAAAWLAELDVVVVWRLSSAPFGGGGGETLLPHGYLPLPRSAVLAGGGELRMGDFRLVWAGDEMLELRQDRKQSATVLWSWAVRADPLAGADE